MKIKYLILLTMAFSIFGKSFGQKEESDDYNKDSEELNELGYLIDQSFPFAEELLKKYGEYYPFSFVLENDNKVVGVGQHDGNDNPNSDDVIKRLKEVLRDEVKKNTLKGIAIFYDVRTTDPSTNEKTDAVAVFVEHKNGNTAYKFYYPYTITSESNLIFGKSFGTAATREIFD